MVKCRFVCPAQAACHSSPGGDSQVLLGVASEGVGTEAVINPVSSRKALIIQHDVSKCHRTHFLSTAKTEPLRDMINGPDFHCFSHNLCEILKHDPVAVEVSQPPASF